MSDNWKSRTELLLGKERMDRLQNSHVLVAGLGGVGAYAAEEICRAGVGEMTIVDADTINESNLNTKLLSFVAKHYSKCIKWPRVQSEIMLFVKFLCVLFANSR